MWLSWRKLTTDHYHLQRFILTISDHDSLLGPPSSSLVLNPDATHIWNFLQSVGR
jgi:hypothetical protein